MTMTMKICKIRLKLINMYKTKIMYIFYKYHKNGKTLLLNIITLLEFVNLSDETQ